jgi:creatinine amidohydrolase
MTQMSADKDIAHLRKSASICGLFLIFAASSFAAMPPKGILLENLTWIEAEKVLTPDTVVVIPLGAESKEHGPHLKLKNDYLIAEYLKKRILQSSDVVVAPTINYSFYPAFLEYPGSTSLRLETARDVVVDICRSLAKFGPKRFYILNTGISTLRPLAAAAEVLAGDGILMRYLDLHVTESVEKQIRKEEGGTHAEEIETSMMLYMAPESVDMKKAVKDYNGSKPGGLTREWQRNVLADRRLGRCDISHSREGKNRHRGAGEEHSERDRAVARRGRPLIYAHSQTYSQQSAPFARHFVSVTRALFAPHISMAFLCHPTTVRQSWRENVGASYVRRTALLSASRSYVRRPAS